MFVFSRSVAGTRSRARDDRRTASARASHGQLSLGAIGHEKFSCPQENSDLPLSMNIEEEQTHVSVWAAGPLAVASLLLLWQLPPR
jgi:hypothetical protein